ncbi:MULTISPECIES: AAA family ATPase [unclassified Dolichospermum]|uniref:AAA family ATPase n=1 Tax=unclassified Dolichospermum TaxID=2622029 RepID=UPI001444C175|nr:MULTISPECIES: AAA family ATPase [unclassified Dolichospermum]
MPKNKAKSPITGFRISNFKAFAGNQYIPIRPITLIYGANSSGKSSVLHSLLLAHHAITNKGELDVYRTKAGGDSVDLGGFGQYVNQRQRSNVIEWAVDLDPKHLNLQNIGLNIDHLESLLKDVNNLTARILIGISPAEKGRVRVLSFFIEADDNSILRMSHIPGGNSLKLNYIGDTPIINQLIDTILERMKSTSTPRPPSREELQQAIDELVPEITAEVSRLLPTQREIRDDEFISSSETRQSELTTEVLASFLASKFIENFTSLIEIIHDAVENEIGRLQYLGPFRTYPPRHFAFSRQKDANWEAGGGYAWDILLNNTEVRNKVNAWLGDRDRMKTPYELRVRHLFSDTEVKGTIDSRITNKLRDLTTQLMFHSSGLGEPELQETVQQLRYNIETIGTDFENYEQILTKLQETDLFEEIKELTSLNKNSQQHPLNGILVQIEAILSSLTDTDSLSDDWVGEMKAKSDRISDIVLIGKNGITLSHRDVGIGISQVIPILVSCYSLSDSLIAIEQPEIHLHPKLQAELGDVFIESALGEQKNTFILETHSEHLLLRIMRRMRETYNNELPEGCLPVRPEDVSVLFVDTDSRGSFVREMPLNKRGELVKAWPGGFFEEGLEEVFS